MVDRKKRKIAAAPKENAITPNNVSTIFVRLLVDNHRVGEATYAASTLLAESGSGSILRCKTDAKPSAKNPSITEVSLTLQISGDARDAVEAIRSYFKDGWAPFTGASGRWITWNRLDDNSGHITWASLETQDELSLFASSLDEESDELIGSGNRIDRALEDAASVF